ncbi:hypothetical protein, partial [Bacteroides heparinolyticus]|uniref:hypothetical protein n=1 Tax=Prevotella heparinolytica TaxID=28113 RepID=UPI0035A065A3
FRQGYAFLTEEGIVPHRGTPSSSPRNEPFLGGGKIMTFHSILFCNHISERRSGTGHSFAER